MNQTEAFEIAEYGHQPSEQEIRRLLDDLVIFNYDNGFPPGAKILRFLENNDVPRFRAHHALALTRMAAALLFSLHGVPLLYYGQESGITDQWPLIHPTRTIQSYDAEGLWPYYQHLIRLRAAFPSLYSDHFEEVPGYTAALYAVDDSILRVSVPTPVERSAAVPERVVLEQNYPNPFIPGLKEICLSKNTYRKQQRTIVI